MTHQNPFVVWSTEAERFVSYHRTERAARKAAWRLARSEFARSEWFDLDETRIREEAFSIGVQRDAMAVFGERHAVISELVAMFGVPIASDGIPLW